MKVIELSKSNQDKLEGFVKEITVNPTRPAMYIGIDDDGDPVLHVCEMTWKEMAYLKTCLDMHIIRDWGN